MNNKIKVCAEVTLRNIPRNYILLDIPDEFKNDDTAARNWAVEKIKNQINLGSIAFKSENGFDILPNQLIQTVNVFVDDIL